LGVFAGLIWTAYTVTVAILAMEKIESAPFIAIALGIIVIIGTAVMERSASQEPAKPRRKKPKTKLHHDNDDFSLTPPVDFLPDPLDCPVCDESAKNCPCGDDKMSGVNHYWEYMKCQKKIKRLELYAEAGTIEYEQLREKADQHYEQLSGEDKDKADDAMQNLWKLAED